jgi:hypothetical protein
MGKGILILVCAALVGVFAASASAASQREGVCNAGASGCVAQASGHRGHRVDVVLGLRRHQQALQRFARHVSNPSLPSYGHYLWPRLVGRRTGANHRVSRTVRTFLRRRGIRSTVEWSCRFP